MRLPMRDTLASCAVAGAVTVYVLWLADAVPFDMGIRATALVILVLGFVASASAVVPGFTRLLHGNKIYLTATSLLGLAALAAGLVALWSAGTVALAVLVGTLVALWAISTTHHVVLSRTDTCPACGAPVAGTYCGACGHDLRDRAPAEARRHGTRH